MDKRMSNEKSTVALRWWQSMHLSPGEIREVNATLPAEVKKIQPAPRAWKAELKRSESLDAILLTQGFRALWLNLGEKITTGDERQVGNNMLCWGMVAAALTFVTKDSDDSFATLAGKNGQGDKPVVSEMRFAQLQQSQTPDEFARRLRRILQQLKGEASVSQLAQDICQWYQEHISSSPGRADKRIAVNWAMKYYQAAK